MAFSIKNGPAAHQPTKAAMEEVIQVEGTPEQIAPTALIGEAPRRPASSSPAQASQKQSQTDDL